MSQTLTRTGMVVPSADASDWVMPPADIRAVGLWVEVNGVMFKQDLLAARPAAGKQGRLFFPSDKPGRADYDNGTTWVTVAGDDPLIAAMMGVY